MDRRTLIFVTTVIAALSSEVSPASAALYLDSFGSSGSGPGQLAGPDGIAMSDAGDVYVADTYNGRVLRFTGAGAFVSSFGTPGSGPGQFIRPYGIDVDSDGNVYVSDIDRNDVQKFSAQGQWLLTFGQELSQPFGLWVEDGGSVYVTDRPAGCVRKFGADGVFQGNIGPNLVAYTMTAPQNVEGDDQGLLYISDGSAPFRIVVVTTTGLLVRTFASPPNSAMHGNPTGGDFAAGNFYLTQYNLNRLVVLDPSGAVLDVLGDNEPVSFLTPLDAATSGDSLLYVLDTGNSRVHRFRLGATGQAPVVHVESPNGGEALIAGSTVSLQWAAMDDGTIVSSDLLLSRDAGGSFETIATGVTGSSYSWTVTGPASTRCLLLVRARDDHGLTGQDTSDGPFSITSGSSQTQPVFLSSFGTPGPAPGQFNSPDGIATSDDGFLYVADTYNSRVQKFTLEGAFVGAYGSHGAGPGQFSRPYGIDVDPDGNVYVGDLDRAVIQKFSASGQHLATFGSGQLSQPFGLWVSDEGIVYVTDRPARRIVRFTTAGAHLGAWGPQVGSLTLSFPQNIEGDGDGLLYVSDGDGRFRVHVLSETGAYLRTLQYPSSGNPTGAALARNFLWLSEYNLDRVLGIELSADEVLFTLNQAGGIAMDSPIDCATYEDSLLFVLDTGVGRVLRYRLVVGAPTVTVLFPNGGESLALGSTATLRWHAVDDQGVTGVDLHLSRDGGLTYALLEPGVANTGAYEWHVGGPPSTTCRLRVVAHDANGLAGGDESNANWRIVTPAGPNELTFVDTFGSGVLSGPDGIATSDDGFVFVADTYHHRVVKFTADGQVVSTFGSEGVGPGQFSNPYGIDLDPAGNVYVSDFGGRRLQKFDAQGQYVATLAGPDDLSLPLGLWVSDEGVVYLTDRAAHVVRRYTTDGTALAPWGPNVGSATLVSPQNVEGEYRRNGRLDLHVSDGEGAFQVVTLDENGQSLGTFAAPPNGNPTGAALLGSRLLLTVYNQNRVYVITTTDGTVRETLGDDDPYTFSSPIDAASHGDSVAYVLDTANNRVVRFRWDGTPPPHARITGPNGGEQFTIGAPMTLEWVADDDDAVTGVDLWISRDDGATYVPLAFDVPNSGTYDWIADGPASDHCLVRAVARDALDLRGDDHSDQAFAIAATTAVGERDLELTLAVSPNPMRQDCRFAFSLPRAGDVRLSIHDLQGRLVTRLSEGRLEAGRHERTWSAVARQEPVAPGLYFVRLELAGERVLRRRLVLTR